MKARSKFKGTSMTMQEIQEYDFGLYPGQIVRFKATGSRLGYSIPWDGETYTVKITKEYPYMFSGILYPRGDKDKCDLSDSYNISFGKVDIMIGDIDIKVME